MRSTASPVRATVLALAATLLTLPACLLPTSSGEDFLVQDVTVVTGANQTATAGQTLPVPIMVVFTDAAGQTYPRSGGLANFTWELVSPGGSLEPVDFYGHPQATPRQAAVWPNRDGTITVKWTLSNRPGIDSLKLSGSYWYKGEQTWIEPLILTATVLAPAGQGTVR